MAYDKLLTINDESGGKLKIMKVALNLDKNIFLLHVFEENYELNKKFIRNELVIVENEILTSTFADTIHFMEELSLFDFGNNQNKYLDITEYKKIKNLKLIHNNEKNIFISRSEAKAMYKIFNLAFLGYSVASVLEKEFKFTPQILSKVLHKNQLLEG
ncbi:hypothetical protein LPB137_05245 [Poseidonibacter parvus]|uniref:Uncharacterized protein n=1 Tax=Poseidonibacter parvus TaxID=1850254 RepID=A0A1P8KL91_9BACT|nr:hypothetical protein [Poseidonibacter parvus]APW65295.1 hypothetical protein LPB137_05245 [Poseidonibacter parvus]